MQIKSIFQFFSSKKKLEPIKPVEPDTSFNSLSPIDNADTDGHYSKALLWALQNRKAKDIKNIALTGPYGSGKSSILRTFEKNNDDEDLVFLNISLATFKEELISSDAGNPDDKGAGVSSKNDAVLRLIELSILQQIFYHEEDHNIPDSRFKKTRSFSKGRVWNLTIGLFLFSTSLIYQLYPDLLKKLLRWEYGPIFEGILHYSTLVFIIAGGFLLILKGIRPLRSIQLKKFNFQDAEFGIDESISKSILNDHLDEILYFFEVTSYTVVVIEDLDRFRQTEIFTKLRELNQLINYSKKTKRFVAFVYAVRDDMFQDKDRTKFFDFIIPVIPVINSSNSNEKFLQIIKDNKYPIANDLIENISLFIDDMRLLYNITNEYKLYKEKLSSKLNQNKLFAMIVYKNIYPNDFVALSNSKGRLYEIFNSKSEYILKEENKIDEEIKTLKARIEKEKALKINDIKELRKLYILQYLSKMQHFHYFMINDQTYQPIEVLNDELFDAFINDKVFYNYYRPGYGGYSSGPVPNNFNDIEKEVDPQYTYQKRVEQIESWQNNQSEELKIQVAKKEDDKARLRHSKIKELMANDDCEITIEDAKQNQLVNILLRSGYIDEEYLDYVSIFYEGSITKKDREFLLNVKAHIKTEFDVPLEKIETLIPKIPVADYGYEFVLNYSLFDYLLANDKGQHLKKSLLSTLSNEKEGSFKFVGGYLEKGTQIPDFINQLVKHWPDIWKYVDTKSVLTQEDKKEYFRLIVTHADEDDIKKIATKSKFANYISEYEEFLTIITDEQKLRNIISNLDIKFSTQNLEAASNALVHFLHNGNHYVLSQSMIAKIIVAVEGSYDPDDFLEQNYTAIKSSGCKALIKYVDSNLNNYVENVLLKLPNNKREDEEFLTYLLNEESLNDQYKEAIIRNSETLIADLDEIEELNIKQSLLHYGKVVTKWDNIINYNIFIGQEIDEMLLDFLNTNSVIEVLSKEKINVETPIHDLEMVKNFIEALLLEEGIDNEGYANLLNAVPYYYPELNFEDLSSEKTKLLIVKKKLGLSKENYDLLKANFLGLHTLLAEHWIADFTERLDEFEIDVDDTIALLKSTKFSSAEKNTILNELEDDIIIENVELCSIIRELILNNPQFTVSNLVLINVLRGSLSIDRKVKLLILRISTLNNHEITDIIGSWPYPYEDIVIKGKRPLLPKEDENWELSQFLIKYNLIKNASAEKSGIRISTFRK